MLCHNMKKLLLLGGDATLLPVIEAAHKRGYYVITCDYLPENIAHKYSDEFINHSTTDKEEILEWAQENQIDGVLTFTDSGVLTAAYICEKMNLACLGSYKAIEIIQNKDMFRRFLKDNGCNVPEFFQYSSWNEIEKDIDILPYPVMIKPVDAAGSKGVTKVLSKNELKQAYDYATRFSIKRLEVIIEQFIDPIGPQIHGDVFVQNGRVIFHYLGDHHFDMSINNLVPVSTTWPSTHSDDEIQKVLEQIQMFVTKVGFQNGCMNIESRIDKNDENAYLIDVGARSGGNYTPFVIHRATGFDFVETMLDFSMEGRYRKNVVEKKGYYAYLVIHSKTEGELVCVNVDKSLDEHVVECHKYIEPGMHVRSFRGANAAIGILIVRFETAEDMQRVADNLDKYIQVITEICVQ